MPSLKEVLMQKLNVLEVSMHEVKSKTKTIMISRLSEHLSLPHKPIDNSVLD